MAGQTIPFAGGGYVTPFYDDARVRAMDAGFSRSISQSHSVLEVGAGSGNLSFIAAQYAGEVVGVEDDDSLVAIFASMLETFGKGNVELVKADNLHEYKPERTFDVLICEIVSAGLLLQPQAPLLNRYLKYLKPGGQVFPHGITNSITLVEADFAPYGIPFRFAYREREDLPVSTTKSATTLLNSFVFTEGLPGAVKKSVITTAISSGTCNAIRIESIINVSAEIAINGRPTLCPPVVVPLPDDMVLVAGRQYEVEISYEHASDVIDHPQVHTVIREAPNLRTALELSA
jgi:predicted RNA methylase